MALPKYGLGEVFSSFFHFGKAGVDFFFVLSGFILVYAHYDDLGKPSTLSLYLKKRVIRIYPVYWVVTLLILPIYFFHPSFGVGYESDAMVVLKSLALVPQDHNPILGVAWTLRHEILFYLLFGALIFNIRVGLLLFGFWAIGIPLVYLTGSEYPYSFFFSIFNLEFLLGMATGYLVVNYRIDRAGWLLPVGVICFLIAGVAETSILDSGGSFFLFRTWYGLSSSIMISSLAWGELAGSFKSPDLMFRIGSASYSIYLVHHLFISFAVKVVVAVGAGVYLPLEIIFALLVFSSVWVGVVFHTVIERPMLYRLKRAFSGS